MGEAKARVRPFNDHTHRLLKLALPSKSRVLDAGCGLGQIAFWLAEDGGHCVYAVDPRLPLPSARWHAVSDLSGGKVMLMNSRIEQLPRPLPAFECVLALGLLHALGSSHAVNAVLGRLSESTLAGGRLAISWLVTTHQDGKRSEAHHPTVDEVARRLVAVNIHTTERWMVEAAHSHGGSAHTHTVAYLLARKG